MSKHNDHKSNLTTNHTPDVKSKTSKLNLLSDFVKFMAWVIVIGLLLSTFACQPVQLQDAKTLLMVVEVRNHD